MSLVEVCATCLRCHLWVAWSIFQDFFYELQKKFQNNAERIFLVFKTDFLYHQNAHFILYTADLVIFKYISYFFFMATKVNRSTKSDFFYKFPKIIIKKHNQKKKLISPLCPT